jgi:hypothetical protein
VASESPGLEQRKQFGLTGQGCDAPGPPALVLKLLSVRAVTQFA